MPHDHWGLLGEPPSEVQVTVLSSARTPTLRAHLASMGRLLRPRVILAVALAAVTIAGVTAATVLGWGAPRPAARSRAMADQVVAPGCVNLGFALHDTRFGRSGFDYLVQCPRDRGYATPVAYEWQGGDNARLYQLRYYALIAAGRSQ